MSNNTSAKTLSAPFTLHGYGLHGNKPCSVTVKPAEGGGLLFLHKPSGAVIPASADCVGDLSLATTLAKDGARLGTVEHILSALYGLGVDHAVIEAYGEELPILDGSAAPWVMAIKHVGTRELGIKKVYIKVLRTIQVQNGKSRIQVSPYNGLRLNYLIDFPHSSIGTQSLKLSVTPDTYMRELADARTFCLKSEIEAMHSRGLALGGSLENAVVFSDEGCMNESLRFKDEAVRHKMLDLMGDLALLGAPLLGTVEAHAAGHAMHVALVKRILSEPDAWTKSEMDECPQTSAHRLLQADFGQRPLAV